MKRIWLCLFFISSVCYGQQVNVLGGYNASATSVTLFSGQGINLPGTFVGVWWNTTDNISYQYDPNAETIYATRTIDVLSVTRGYSSPVYPHQLPGRQYAITALNPTSTPTFTPTGSATPTPTPTPTKTPTPTPTSTSTSTPTITPTPTLTPTFTPVGIGQPVTVVGNFAYQSSPVSPFSVLVGGQSPANNNVQPLPLDPGGNNLQVLASQGSAPYSITNQGVLFPASKFTSITTGTPCTMTQGGLYWAWHVTLGNTNPATCELDGSIDGTNYDTVIGTQTLTGSGGQTFAPSCFPYVRPKINGWTLSATPTVTIQTWGRQ